MSYAYESLSWPQVQLLAEIVKVNRALKGTSTDAVHATVEGFNHSSIWALHKRGIVVFDQEADTVRLDVKHVPLANYCLKRVEGLARNR